MNKTIAALTLSLIVPVAAWAQVPATQPTTLPTTQPTTQPTAAAETKVLVAAFTPVEASDPDWIGRAVQQSLVADLTRATGSTASQAVAESGRISSADDAIAAGKKAGARYVIFGSYQRIEPNLRITGQMIDVNTGKVVAGLKATGSDRDLFEMQDTLAFQAKFGLGNERLAEKPKVAPAEKPDIKPQGPVVVAGDRYANSALSGAVADGRSLLDRHDAAGSSFRNDYYDQNEPQPTQYGWPIGTYGGVTYYTPGEPYGWWWWNWGHGWAGRYHGHICNSSCGHIHTPRPTPVPAKPARPDRFPFSGSTPTVGARDYSIGQGNTMGSYPQTMQGAQRNYNQNTDRNYNSPTPTVQQRPNVSSGVVSGQTSGSRGASRSESAPAPRANVSPAPAPPPQPATSSGGRPVRQPMRK